jgi:anti-sigma regulatory factor (Ser/Thr protein kinase)
MTDSVYEIRRGDYEGGGAASRALKLQLKTVGADPAVVRRAMVAAYEAEMNVVIHARGGQLRFRLRNGQLDVEVTDRGPGIDDIERALEPGFSTASAEARQLGFGAGMGLPNIRHNADTFAVESSPEGTRVRFSIRLKSPQLYGEGRHSLEVAPALCRNCLHCLSVCPTQALRVFRGQPQVLDYLCVDCAACVSVCPSRALQVTGADVELTPREDSTLLVPPGALVQFGLGVTPQRVLDVLNGLGFQRVVTTAPWEHALRAAVLELARGGTHPRPVISPVCEAVVNLVETRFPSLIPHLAPLASPLEAARETLRGRHVTAVVSCPCQRTALLADEEAGDCTIVLATTFRAAVQPLVVGESDRGQAEPVPVVGPGEEAELVEVSGIGRVVEMLEKVENGLAGDVRALEAYVCDEAGFGAPLLSEAPSLARHRWEAAVIPEATGLQAVARKRAYQARPGLRLDGDMSKAIQKLGRIDKLARSLPGLDCGMCGAPTCGALAEDIVRGRATPDACTRQDTGTDAKEKS